MRWNTSPVWDEERQAWIFRRLLSNKNSKKFVQDIINEFLGKIYDYAADNVDHCHEFAHPQQFFATAKENFPQAQSIRDEVFWIFTYKAFHARNIFEEYQIGSARSKGQPLSKALDFLALPQESQSPVELQEVLDRRGEILRIVNMYFPMQLTDADHIGDGKDHVMIVSKNPHYFSKNAGRSVQETMMKGMMDEDGNINPHYYAGGEEDEDMEDMEAAEALDPTEPAARGLRAPEIEEGLDGMVID
ncbi:uncharacterized protein JN550_006530 [Neoarthrinium moseri]|uniref:uncharacterized protein n=1 Tax=Neoarthrinium moseri TaxID=1658444 RepID=UPI001FDB9D86|nr:uncharacterized protein JN550_006530 [Neoarthrinium moseri]KAI1868042.1 hypothetical protein JN550_006530 [Neoarthrinium moseri]